MKRIISREGEALRVSILFFKSMAQLVQLFAVETRVVTHLMGRVLGGFQDQVARQLTGRILRKWNDRKRKYTLDAAAREEAGFKAMT